MMRKTYKKGSSLLVTILVMGVLMTLTLGLSSLVIREISQTTDMVASGRAYFAAEAATENALLDLKEHLPGYEVGCLSDGATEWKAVEVDDYLSYQYRICNRGNTYPYFDQDKPIFLHPEIAITRDVLYDQNPKETYNVLALNQTVTIPLLVQNQDGSIEDIHSFLIQYYVDFDVDPEITPEFKGINVAQFDILRWKLFGEPLIPPDSGKTEVISDFFPASPTDEADNPVCIGSDPSLTNIYGRCQFPVAKYVKEQEDIENVGSLEDFADADVWSQARECYQKDAGVSVAGMPIQKGCSIATFVNNHTKNYITLTNLVNPDIIGITDAEVRNRRANIYYRIVAKDETVGNEKVLVREAAEISADGFALKGKIKQSIDVKLKLNSFLPVFNFSLYRTDTTQ